jgi:hypothetical protein
MAENKYYYESVGECVSQVYEIEGAKEGDGAKKIAFRDMKKGDIIAECPPSAIQEDSQYPEYHSIDKAECANYATLCKGTWARREPSGEEYWEDDVWFYSDADENYLDSKGNEFEDWEKDDTEDDEIDS